MSKTETKEKKNGTFKGVKKTAKFMTIISKKRLEISLIKKEISRKYEKLGRIYYKDYITDEEPDSAEYEPLCKDISDCFRRVNKLRKEIDELNDKFFDRKAKVTEDVDFVSVEDLDVVEDDNVTIEEVDFTLEDAPVADLENSFEKDVISRAAQTGDIFEDASFGD